MSILDIVTPFLPFSGAVAAAQGQVNLLAAIHARFRATAALVAAVPGGMWTDQIPDDRPYPCASINEVGGVRGERNTSGFEFQDRVYQITVLITGHNAKGIGADLVELFTDAYSPKQPVLTWRRGYSTFTAITDDHFQAADAQAQEGEGRRLNFQILELVVTAARNPAS